MEKPLDLPNTIPHLIESPPESAVLEAAEESKIAYCLNCETRLLGKYCYHCGQKSDVRRFTLKTLLSYLYESFRKFDSEVRNTFLNLLFRPGEFCRRYLQGKRKGFNDPVKYFFISFVFQVTIFGFVRYFAQNPDIDEAAKVETQTQLIILLVTFFWAIAYTIVFRRAGYNLAENTVCMLFLAAETRVFSVVIQLLFLPLATVLNNPKLYYSMLGLIVTIIYFVYFSRQFYKESWSSTILKNLLVLIIFALIFIPAFFIYVAILMATGAVEAVE